jgi:dihydrofolate reductase
MAPADRRRLAMSEVVLDVSMSLDGFTAGSNVRHDDPFAFDGLETAVRRAKDAAGDKDVWVLGADVARRLLRAGLLDVVRLHLVPMLMGEGTPLFAGERAELIPEGKPVAGSVTHLRYRVSEP